jgi:hypothetical protein
LHKNGNIPNFEYIDKNGKQLIAPIHNIGDGLIFKGTQTFHAVTPNNNTDNNTERIVIGFQYIDKQYENSIHVSLCSELRSKDIFETISIILPHLLLFSILANLIYQILDDYKININIDTYTLIVLTILLIIIIPLYNSNKNINTSIIIFLLLLISTFNIHISLLFTIYLQLE